MLPENPPLHVQVGWRSRNTVGAMAKDDLKHGHQSDDGIKPVLPVRVWGEATADVRLQLCQDAYPGSIDRPPKESLPFALSI